MTEAEVKKVDYSAMELRTCGTPEQFIAELNTIIRAHLPFWQITLRDVNLGKPKVKFAVFQIHLKTKAGLAVFPDKMIAFAVTEDKTSDDYVPAEIATNWMADYVASLLKTNAMQFNTLVDIYGPSALARGFAKELRKQHNEFKQKQFKSMKSHRLYFVEHEDIQGTIKKKKRGSFNPFKKSAGKMRLATAEDLPELKSLSTPPNESPRFTNDHLTSLVSQHKVYVWEKSTAQSNQVNSEKKSDLVSFAILDFFEDKGHGNHHQRLDQKLDQLVHNQEQQVNYMNTTCVELIDLHPATEEAQKHHKELVYAMGSKFLRESGKEEKETKEHRGFDFLFVRVDSDIPESSDSFLKECTFRFDCTMDVLSMDAGTSGSKKKDKKKGDSDSDDEKEGGMKLNLDAVKKK
jgi:hypothetical protein